MRNFFHIRVENNTVHGNTDWFSGREFQKSLSTLKDDNSFTKKISLIGIV